MLLALPMSLARRRRLHLIRSAAKARMSGHAAVVHGLICGQVRGIGAEVLFRSLRTWQSALRTRTQAARSSAVITGAGVEAVAEGARGAETGS
jgi:hypothetical protein